MTIDALSKACIVFYSSNTGIAASKPSPGKNTYMSMRLFCVSMGNGTGGLFVQGIVSNMETRFTNKGLQNRPVAPHTEVTNLQWRHEYWDHLLNYRNLLQKSQTLINGMKRTIRNTPRTWGTLYLSRELMKSAEYAALLRQCAKNWKVAGSIPDGVIGIFRWHNHSGHTTVLGSTQPLT
jgi:hypothetical protein